MLFSNYRASYYLAVYFNLVATLDLDRVRYPVWLYSVTIVKKNRALEKIYV